MDIISIINEINNKFKTKLIFEKVSFFKDDNKIVIDLNTIKIPSDMVEIAETIKQKLSFMNMEIIIRVLGFEDLLDIFIRNLNFDIDVDDSKLSEGFVYFNIKDKMYEELIKSNKFYINLKDIFTKFNISIKFNVFYDEEYENSLKQLEEENNQIVQEKIKKASENKIKEIKKQESGFFYGFMKDYPKEITSLEDIEVNFNKVCVRGKIEELNIIKVKNGQFVKFDLDDGKYAIRCKLYVKDENIEKFNEGFSTVKEAEVTGIYNLDSFENIQILNVSSIKEISIEKRTDNSSKKRIEFNIHTKFSMLEGLVDLDDLFSTLKRWNHTSVGITDLYNVQAYPEIYSKAKKNNIKLNLGLDAKILDENLSIITNHYSQKFEGKDIVVFDIETTGLSRYNDKITEIGAVKIRNGEIIEEFQELVNPEMPLSDFIVELTGITNEMLADKRKISEILPLFLEFSRDCILSAHNAEFDMGFIIENSKNLNIDFKPIYFDTLYLARGLNPFLKNHKLDTLSKHYKVKLLNHHRASDDARATAMIFLEMVKELEERKIKFDENINNMPTEYPISKNNRHQAIIFVQNKEGLKNLYTLVSKSSLEFLNNSPGIPFNIFEKYRKGLLIGGANYNSHLFDLIALGYPKEIYIKEAQKYDFFRVLPIDFSDYLVSENYIKDKNHLIEINKKIIELGKKLKKLVVASGDVFYIDRHEYIYKNILMNYPRKKFVENTGCFYLKTTEEMLDNFNYLSEEDKKWVVIDAPRDLDSMIENISPIADGTFPPIIENAEQNLREETFAKAREIYGDNLPEIVEKRLEKELNSIISNGYATLYIIAQKLVRKSNEEGYLVGSRGSVGSSFAATMADITEVNPLPAHYVCPSCKHSEFFLDGEDLCGVDLPPKPCIKCGTMYKRDGYDIPFEVFLGFEGDKEPDIDLNFASVYQSKIHKYTETLFGNKKVFRAGTLGTIADKTAFGMARKYKEFYPGDNSIKLDIANINKIKRKLVGVKRTTGQHAGGLIIVPENKDIEDFTPVQYPADQESTGIITTHFDYHAIDKNLLKLDLLGHNAPTIVRMLTDQSGVNSIKIDLSDKDTMSIFSSTEKLNIKSEYTNINSGSIGIPEFGTNFVREMLKDTKPTTFGELVRISGLSHGTDVWLNNAKDLVVAGQVTLKEAICTRDDIMNYLISQKMDSKLAFDIMEKVRKGKGLSDSDEAEMKRLNIANWYIDSCNKIKYMFPKAHAVAYVMMAYRIAYYKVHYPEYFYSTYFTNKIADFQYFPISNGLEYLTGYMKSLMNEKDFEKDDKYYCLEIGEEMLARGIKLLKPDLYLSDPEEFTVPDKNVILPPLMAVENISQAIALSISKARNDGKFISVEDFKSRTKINKTALASIDAAGLLDGLQQTNQMDFFSM